MEETKTKVKYKASKGKYLTADEARELTKRDGYWNGIADKHNFNVNYEEALRRHPPHDAVI